MSAPGATAEGLELARSLDESLARILDTEALLAATAADAQLGAETLATIRELGTGLVGLGEEEGGLGIGLGDRLRLAAVFGRRLVPAVLRDETFGLVPALSALAAAGAGGDRVREMLEAAAEVRGAVALGPRPDAGPGSPLFAAFDGGARLLAVLGAGRIDLFELPDSPAGDAGPAPRALPVAGLDAGQGLTRVELDGALPLASLAGEAAATVRREYELALACEAFGAGERALEMAVEYAGQRQQFGRPIAAFQAVSHLLAEIKLEIEVARAGIGRAVDVAAEDGAAAGALEDWTATLRHTVPAAARRACEGSIQVHGGIGFSWELGLHLGYRRVLAVQYLLGGEAASAEAVGAAYMKRRSER